MTAPASRADVPIPAWRLWVAPIVWAVHFLAIYAVTALACARHGAVGGGMAIGIGGVSWVIGGLTLVAVAVLVATMRVSWRGGRPASPVPEPDGFVHWLTTACCSVALLGVLWEALPVIWVPVCG